MLWHMKYVILNAIYKAIRSIIPLFSQATNTLLIENFWLRPKQVSNDFHIFAVRLKTATILWTKDVTTTWRCDDLMTKWTWTDWVSLLTHSCPLLRRLYKWIKYQLMRKKCYNNKIMGSTYEKILREISWKSRQKINIFFFFKSLNIINLYQLD